MRAETSGPVPSPPPPGAGKWNFAIFAGAQFTSFTGTWMQKAAVGWLAWDLTHSPAWVGAVALSDLVAAASVGPLSGAVTDRANPLRMIVATQSIAVAEALVLWLLLFAGVLTPWLLLAWAIFDACLQTFSQPVRIVAIASLAPPERMGQAIAANSVAVNLARIVGPAVAGGVMLKSEVGNVILLNIALISLMLAIVMLTRSALDRPKDGARNTGLLADVRLGFGYIRHDPKIGLLFVLAISFAVLARPFAELMPALAGGAFDGGPGTLSLFLTAQGCGALIGAIWLLGSMSMERLVKVTWASAICIGVTLSIFSFMSDLRFALVAIGFAGFFHVVCNTGMQRIAQMTSEPSMRGRVVSLYWLIFRAGTAVSALGLGLLAERLHLQALIGIAALAFLLISAALLRPGRRIYGLDSRRPE